MKKRLQKTLAIILTAALLLCCLPGAFAAEGFADMPDADAWSHAGLDYCIAAGLMHGMTPVTVAPYCSASSA